VHRAYARVKKLVVFICEQLMTITFHHLCPPGPMWMCTN
jgi:hypothetical protein